MAQPCSMVFVGGCSVTGVGGTAMAVPGSLTQQAGPPCSHRRRRLRVTAAESFRPFGFIGRSESTSLHYQHTRILRIQFISRMNVDTCLMVKIPISGKVLVFTPTNIGNSSACIIHDRISTDTARLRL